MDYNFLDIKEAYKKLGIGAEKIVLLKTNLATLGRYESSEKNKILMAHYDAIVELMDFSQSTLVVSTATTSLCNTNIPFNPKKTPSEMGMLTEYIRTRKESIRSFHPFDSWAAIGKDAKFICEDISRHAFGPETPKDRMINLGTTCVSLGANPRFTCSVVHHVEFMMGVPYRYVKEFEHPVIRNNNTTIEPFYLYVWYRQSDIKRNLNVKIFEEFKKDGNIIKKASLGRGTIFSYNLTDFYHSAVKAFKNDIYIWLNEAPIFRPYQK